MAMRPSMFCSMNSFQAASTLGDQNLFHKITLLQVEHYVHSLCHLTKDRMFAIQVRLRLVTNEELAAVSIWASVGHAQAARLVFVRIVPSLVFEGVARAAPAITVRAPSLGYKPRDDPVKGKSIVKPIPGQEHKIIHRLGGI
jgi:hypothetical protein